MKTARIVRTANRPSCVRFGHIRPWKWQITTFCLVTGEYPGVKDRWQHICDDSGWAMTLTGARWAAGRRVAAAEPATRPDGR